MRIPTPTKLKILNTRADGWSDQAMAIGGPFFGELNDWIESRGFDHKYLYQSEATRYHWDQALKAGDITYIAHLGHGNYVTITGYRTDVLAAIGDYDPALYQGLGFHWLSCQTGKILIPDIQSKGAIWVCGYDETYTFHYTPGKDPLDDPVASCFFDGHLILDHKILTGSTAQAAFEQSQALYLDRANWLRNHGSPQAASTILFDREHHIKRGDGMWTPGGDGSPPEPIVKVRIELVPKENGKKDIEFTVVNSKTQQPVKGAEVVLAPASTPFADTRTTNEQGIAVFEDKSPGNYDWSVSKAGFNTSRGTVVVPA